MANDIPNDAAKSIFICSWIFCMNLIRRDHIAFHGTLDACLAASHAPTKKPCSAGLVKLVSEATGRA